MKVAVKDACVLIDLANGGLLEAWFKLGVETYTTDLVLRQIKDEKQWAAVEPFVKSGLLKAETLTGEEVLTMREMLNHLSVGIEDQSVLFLAIKLDAILLTGDRRLRMEGLRKSLEVRGVLWVLDELVSRKQLPPKQATERLQKLLDDGAFLPMEECKKRYSAWA
jgi:hypothetical protein